MSQQQSTGSDPARIPDDSLLMGSSSGGSGRPAGTEGAGGAADAGSGSESNTGSGGSDQNTGTGGKTGTDKSARAAGASGTVSGDTREIPVPGRRKKKKTPVNMESAGAPASDDTDDLEAVFASSFAIGEEDPYDEGILGDDTGDLFDDDLPEDDADKNRADAAGKKQAGRKAAGASGAKRRRRKKAGRRSRDEDLPYHERIRRHRGRIVMLEVFVALLFIAAVWLVASRMRSRHYTRAEFSKTLDYVAEEGSEYTNLNGCILQYGPNGAVCTTSKGRNRWSITYEMDQPIVSKCEDIAAIADYGGRTVYVMNTKRQLGTITTNLPIHKLKVSAGGEVAVVLDDTSGTWIRLYNSDGSEIAYFVRSMEENGYPLDVAVSPDGTTVAVSSMIMNRTSVRTEVSFYSFGSAGQNTQDHIIGSYDYTDEIFPYLEFVSGDNCVAVSDARFVVYESARTQPRNGINNMLTESVLGVYRGKDTIGLLFTDMSGENLYRLDLYNASGTKLGTIGFTMAYDDIQIVGGYVYINNEQSMQIYALDGREVFSGAFDTSVKTLIPSTRLSRLAAVTENQIDAITLR